MSWNQAPPGYGYSPQQLAKNSVLGVISLVFGAVALGIAWVPLCGLVSWPISIVGMILGVIGIVIAATSQGRVGVGVPIGGTILCLVAMIVPLVWFAIIGTSAASMPATQPTTTSAPTTSSAPGN